MPTRAASVACARCVNGNRVAPTESNADHVTNVDLDELVLDIETSARCSIDTREDRRHRRLEVENGA